MGLTIHYSLRSQAHDEDEARKLVTELRRRALDLPFREVSDLADLSGDACDSEKEEHEPEHHWLLIHAALNVERCDHWVHVPPARVLAFTAVPAEGSEHANFGLCKYPSTIKWKGKQIDTGAPAGWSWASFCKTQYASNPAEGGMENFLRAHLSIIRLLDHAREMGILHDVTDEGEYWEKRDIKALVETIGRWNAMIAGFVGQMKDKLGDTPFTSEITKFPNFERLEAEGRADEGEET